MVILYNTIAVQNMDGWTTPNSMDLEVGWAEFGGWN
jgi:hypothetical protein